MASTADPTGPMKLAGEFPAAGRDQWLALAAKAIGHDLAPEDDPQQLLDQLRTVTYDGIVIEPLYTSESAGEGTVDTAGFPGFSPFVRGRTAAGARGGGWDVRQVVDAASAECTAVAELELGATSLWLDGRGLDTIDRVTLSKALEGVYLDLTSVTLDAGDRWAVAAEALLGLWQDKAIGGESASGGFGADPVGAYASSGGTTELAAELAIVTELAGQLASSHPQVRIVTVDATRFHDAGASDGQELGFGLAAGVAYLRAFEAVGLDLATAFRQIELRFAATADQFSTIAKFRAARRLWARVAEVAGLPEAAGDTPIHAVTSAAMMTLYDPWVNMLRGTIACFGAAAGGADAITVLPYDSALDSAGSELGRRIARNTQSILARESNLAQVIDPSGGSWYVEQLTDRLAETAWAGFRSIEGQGGLVAEVRSGKVAERIDTVRQARNHNIVTRRDPLTGVSEFPNVAEPVPVATVNDACDASGGPHLAPANALSRHRYAEPFEALRQRVDRVAAGPGGRPSVFLANLGSPAGFAARASFATSLFEVGGFDTVDGPGSTDPAELAEQFATSGAKAICICSSDAMYERLGVDVGATLCKQGAAAVYLAGRPDALVDELTAAGIDGFLTTGADLEQVLADLLHRLEVP